MDLSLPYKDHPSLRPLGLNATVDAFLRIIFDSFTTPNNRVVFNSFCPNICVALNWKQPNCTLFFLFSEMYLTASIIVFIDPVFFSSRCGKNNQHLPTLGYQLVNEDDERVRSVGAAVEFARDNNLLGVFVDAELLVRAPFF